MLGDTASISLLTGLPGSGKSLRMVEAILEAIAAGKHVYACNIDGLKVKGVTPFDDARKWRELPVGSILFVDEAQVFFGERRGGEPPEYVRMNKIRHDGIQMVLATQQPNYLDTYLRGLVGRHEHLLRRDGKQESFMFSDNQVMDNVRGKIAVIKRTYDHTVYKFQPIFFECYDSAQTHSIKYQMPALLKKVLWVLPIATILFGGTFGYLFWRAAKAKPAEVSQEEASPPATPTMRPSAGIPSGDAGKSRTAAEYTQWLTPVIDDVPWSAPAVSGRDFAADPHVYCMSTVNSCRCVTEQNTPVVPVKRDDICRDIARWGEPYNPFKAPAGREQQRGAGEPDYAQGDSRQEHAGVPATGVVPSVPGRAEIFPRSQGYRPGGSL